VLFITLIFTLLVVAKKLLIITICYEKILFKNPYWKICPQTFDSNMLLASISSFQKASLRASSIP